MKKKLWIAYWIFVSLSVLSMILDIKLAAYSTAIIGASFGWIAFFKSN